MVLKLLDKKQVEGEGDESVLRWMKSQGFK